MIWKQTLFVVNVLKPHGIENVLDVELYSIQITIVQPVKRRMKKN